MEELLKLLKKIKPEVNFVSIVSAINDEFDIEIGAGDIVPENFNSIQAMYELIQKLED